MPTLDPSTKTPIESPVIESREPAPHVPSRRGSEVYDAILWRLREKSEANPVARMVVGFTGSGRNMGVTTVASNVALRAADHRLGRILLVDGNFSNSKIGKLFRCKQSEGLVDYLEGNKQLDDVIYETAVDNLFVLPTGDSSGRGSIGLEPTRAAELVSELRSRFDFVVFDLAPAKEMNRATILARELDSTILVLRSNAVRQQEASQLVDSLINDQVNLVGSVMTRQRRILPAWLEKFV